MFHHIIGCKYKDFIAFFRLFLPVLTHFSVFAPEFCSGIINAPLGLDLRGQGYYVVKSYLPPRKPPSPMPTCVMPLYESITSDDSEELLVDMEW